MLVGGFPTITKSAHCIRLDRQEERDCPYQEVSELQDYHWAQFQEQGWRSNQQCEGFDFGSCRRPLHQCQNRLHYPLSQVPCEPLLSFATSARSVEWAFEKTFFDQTQGQPSMGWTGNCRKLHYDVLFYDLVSMEMEPLGRHLQVELGNELTHQTLQLFNQYCHEHHFPPPVPSKVTALVGDGHQKVMVKW